MAILRKVSNYLELSVYGKIAYVWPDKAALALCDNNSYRRRWLCVRNCDFSKKFFSKKKRLN